MCIRDSLLSAVERVAIMASEQTHVINFDIQASELIITAGAVSYTHLRAHETVLDLVCRLLLEKKTTPHSLKHDYHRDTKGHRKG